LAKLKNMAQKFPASQIAAELGRRLSAPGHGLWRDGGGTDRDTIVVVEVMALAA
jgi:hypothetical protein